MRSRNKDKKQDRINRKLTRVEQYALLANSRAATQDGPSITNTSSTQSPSADRVKSMSSLDTASGSNGRGHVRSLAVEHRAVYEIQNRRPAEVPYDRSFDVRVPIAQFAPQRGIDIGIWAEGSGFKLVARGGWYEWEVITSVRKFFRSNTIWQGLTMLSVFAALFCADIWVVCQVPTNAELDTLLTLVLLVFAVEFLGLSFTDQTYPFSFFFWMDLLGTISMIFDISYMIGNDAGEPVRMRRHRGGLHSNTLKIRSARALRLASRAARLTRILKVMKYMPVFNRGEQQDDKVKMARVISNQLNDVMTTRVALLTICIAITLPLFGMFDYPEFDDSLSAWIQVLSGDADDYYASLTKGVEAVNATKHSLLSELKRFADFYSGETYGPCGACLGKKIGAVFECRETNVDLELDSIFGMPRRRASVWLLTEGRMEVSFNLATPQRIEAAASIGLIWFILIAMVCFGMILSNSVSVIALQPLERMLSVVRERCAQIFKYTSELQDDHAGAHVEEEEEEHHDETKHANEFVLLEKAVSKLAAIADLQRNTDPATEIHDKMDEDDMLVLNMTGVQVPSDAQARFAAKKTQSHRNLGDIPEEKSDEITADDAVEDLINSIPEHVLELLDTWEFDATDLQKEMSLRVGCYVMLTQEGCYTWVRSNVQDARLTKFLHTCESKYLANPFHNWGHALDVTWTVSRFGKLVEVEVFFGDITQFWLMVAAAGHDLGHEGLNNQFLVETNHRLALVYNDKSPLENMHCSSLFAILSEPEANLFLTVEKSVFKEIRKGMITVILHTDITKHNEMLKQLSLLYQMNSEEFDSQGDALLEVLQTPTNSQTVLSMLLHCADVGNPMKPWHISMKLALAVMEEFFNQGDLEEKAGIPVQMLNDRKKVNTPNSQIGFIEFMIAPMVESVVRVFPQLDALAENLGMNLKNWLDVWLEESSPPADAVEKTTTRVLKVYAKLTAVVRTEG